MITEGCWRLLGNSQARAFTFSLSTDRVAFALPACSKLYL